MAIWKLAVGKKTWRHLQISTFSSYLKLPDFFLPLLAGLPNCLFKLSGLQFCSIKSLYGLSLPGDES